MTRLAMDNFEFTMVGYQREPLTHALAAIGFAYSKIEGWESIEDAKGPVMWLYWSASTALANKLMVPVLPVELDRMILSWLAAQPYPREPDHDGSNSKGWRISTEGRNGVWQRACYIRPEWAWHGK